MGLIEEIDRGFRYILQVLPDSLITGITVLAILLGNQTLFALAGSSLIMQALVTGIGYIIIKFNPDSVVTRIAEEPCAAGFINNYWARVRGGLANVDHPYAPSLYLATVAFFAGWGAGLKQLYAEEIDQGVISNSQTTGFLITAFIILAAVMILRIFVSNCETLVGAFVGVATGTLLGYVFSVSLGFATDRKATNIWGMPLLRDRIAAGSPIYTCQKDV